MTLSEAQAASAVLDNMSSFTKGIILIVVGIIIIVTTYLIQARDLDRKAYYECLQVTREIAENNKKLEGGRHTSLPWCRL